MITFVAKILRSDVLETIKGKCNLQNTLLTKRICNGQRVNFAATFSSNDSGGVYRGFFFWMIAKRAMLYFLCAIVVESPKCVGCGGTDFERKAREWCEVGCGEPIRKIKN